MSAIPTAIGQLEKDRSKSILEGGQLRVLTFAVIFVAFSTSTVAQVVVDVPLQVRNCDDAIAWIDKKDKTHWLGRSELHHDPQFRSLPETRSNGTVTRGHEVRWIYDEKRSSTVIRQLYWPNMSASENDAMARLRSAILEHEAGHHGRAREVLAEETSKIDGRLTGQGPNPEAAEAQLERNTIEHITKTNKRVAAEAYEDGAYDVETDHGRNQSARGGQNIRLVCPKQSQMTLPAEWRSTFPNPGSVESGIANVRTGLSALDSTEEGRMLMALGGKDVVQGACAGRLAIRVTDPWSDRFVVAQHLQGDAGGVVWPLRSTKDAEALLKATSSFRETMGGIAFPSPDLDAEERGFFLAAALGSLWHEISRAKTFLDQSGPEQYRALKTWIADQSKTSSSIYSCLSMGQIVAAR